MRKTKEQLQKEKKDVQTELRQHLDGLKDTDNWSESDRKTSDDLMERGKAINAELAQIDADDDRRKAADQFTKDMDQVPGPAHADVAAAGFGQTIGAQFVNSDAYKSFKKDKSPGGQFTFEANLKGDIASMVGYKTTLTEASGGASIATQPQVLPGIVPLLFRRLTIADLIPQGVADSPVIRYLKESTFTNAAAPVAENTVFAESAITFSSVDENVRKIAHMLPVTDEMLQDVSAIQSYLDARMALGVRLTEEDQLLNGDGNAPDLTGFLNRSGLQTAVDRSAANDSDPDAIYKQITNIRVNAFLEPDGVVMHPTNWETIRLSKDAVGQYYAGGPFTDGMSATNLGGGGVSPVLNLWGVRAVVTPAIASGTALVGAFGQAAQIFRIGGLTVEASNSHSDFFARGAVMLRAYERLALAVYRPAAFGTVTNLV